MKKTYLGAICGQPGSYGIVFLDLPGCVSCAETYDGILAMGKEALGGHIGSLVDGGETYAEPTEHSLDDVIAWLDDPEDSSGEPWVGMEPIEVDVPAYPATVQISVKTDIVRAITSGSRAQNPRAFIEDAALRELERIKRA